MNRGYETSSVVEHLDSIHKALHSIPSIKKRKGVEKKKRKRKNLMSIIWWIKTNIMWLGEVEESVEQYFKAWHSCFILYSFFKKLFIFLHSIFYSHPPSPPPDSFTCPTSFPSPCLHMDVPIPTPPFLELRAPVITSVRYSQDWALWQTEQLSYQQGPNPGLWIHPHQNLYHPQMVGMHERASLTDPKLKDLHNTE